MEIWKVICCLFCTKLTIGKNYKFRKKEEMSKVDGRCSFLCNLTGGINIQADCLRQTALFYGKDILFFCVFLGIVNCYISCVIL